MPNIDLSILNQRQTPAFYADVFANRPAAGFVGRIFVSTDTFAFYRDNGTGWDLIGGPGTGTVTGTGANGQVTFWNGASTITGSNDLFWDATNGHLGVNTNAPGTALDVHHDQNTVAILNQTVATNDVRIGFQNNGVGLWRIGAFYNAGANDFGIFDAVGNIQPVTVKNTTGQVLIGTSTVGAGKLVVASASSDNGVQIVGASAPSLRIDNAESGATKRAGLGISTATNNFIQGSADRDFCIFNGSTAAASPILFGIYDAGAANVQEAARISPARNFLLGTTTDAGQKLQVSGTAFISGITTFGSSMGNGLRVYGGSGSSQWDIYLNNANLRVSQNSGSGLFQVDTGATFASSVGIGASSFTSPSGADTILGVYGGQDCSLILQDAVQLWEVYVNDDFYINRGSTTVLQLSRTTGAATFSGNIVNIGAGTTNAGLYINRGTTANDNALRFQTAGTNNWFFGSSATSSNTEMQLYNYGLGTAALTVAYATNNLLIGTTTDAGQKLQVAGMLNSGISYRAGTYTNGDTTPSVLGVSFLGIQNSSPITITNFLNGIPGQIITLYFSDSNTTIDRSNCYLLGGLNFTSTAADTITLIYISGFWYEVSRSINS